MFKFFVLSAEAKLTFEELKWIFLIASILHHFDQKHSIKVETDASEFVISDILTQCEENEELKQHWLSVVFWSKKMKFVKLKYDILNHKLFTIMKIFTHWQHYLKKAHFSIVMLMNHENLQTFMTIKKLLRRQVQWTEKMFVYDVCILYWSEIKNSVNEFLWRLNYVVAVKFENANKKELNFSFIKFKKQFQLHSVKSVQCEKIKILVTETLTRTKI